MRSNITGTVDTPRVSVFRSNKSIYAQAIDDVSGHTIASSTSVKVKKATKQDFGSKVALAFETGKELGKKLLAANVKKIIFDRGHYRYHGRVSKLADGLRDSGVIFWYKNGY